MPRVYISRKNGMDILAGMPDDALALWKQLAIATGHVDPVCCAPEWNLTFHEVFHPERAIYGIARDESILLFGHIVTERQVHCLVPMEDSWMFGQPLLGSRALDLLDEALEDFEKEFFSAVPHVFLSGIQENTPQAAAIYFKYKNEFDFHRVGFSVQCAASLEGGLDGWLGRRSANHRAKLKKALRKASARGIAFERVFPQKGEEAERLFQRMLNVEEKSWKGIGKCGMSVWPSCAFYGSLLQRLAASSSAYVIMASVDGEDIGFIFGSVCGAIYRGQQFSYAEKFRDISLGNVLQFQKVAWLCENGVERYDMGPITGPRMEYKKHWTEQRRPASVWRMAKRS